MIYLYYTGLAEINVISAILKLFPHLADFIYNFTEEYVLFC